MSSIETDFDRLAVLDEDELATNNHYHDSLLKLVPQNCQNALEIACGLGRLRGSWRRGVGEWRLICRRR
jgi:hypothetical protein